MSTENRREVATRRIPFFQNLAKKFVSLGFTPNQISIASAFFALGTGVSFYCAVESESFRAGYLILAIAGILLRLICNLIDGLPLLWQC